MKYCSRKTCQQSNPQSETNFGTCKRTKDGLRPECKYCRKLESANAYIRNPLKFRQRNDKWAVNNPEKAKQARVLAELNAFPYRRFKKDKCENTSCGFVPVDLCQLEVDHIYGNHSNNNPINLQTLCANCHKLKTKLNKDTGPKKRIAKCLFL